MEIPISEQVNSVEGSFPVLVIRTSGGYEIQAESRVTIQPMMGPAWQGDIGDTDINQLPIDYSLTGTVVYSFVDNDGNMKTELNSGCVIEFHPDEDYESWSITGPDRYRVVCMPGGELTVWPSETL